MTTVSCMLLKLMMWHGIGRERSVNLKLHQPITHVVKFIVCVYACGELGLKQWIKIYIYLLCFAETHYQDSVLILQNTSFNNSHKRQIAVEKMVIIYEIIWQSSKKWCLNQFSKMRVCHWHGILCGFVTRWKVFAAKRKMIHRWLAVVAGDCVLVH